MSVSEIQLDAFSTLLGMQLIETGEGSARVQMTVRKDMVNPHGTPHGGAIFSLADTALAVASNSHGIEAVALNVNLNYCRPAAVGSVVTAVVTEDNLTKKTGLYSMNVYGSDDKLIASGKGTVYRTGRPFRGW
ncbi:hydroxyphenylacetyl-CoA thioesterase PaaI [Alicyclobacillus sp. SO9]|uniref:hydroxyphenylacetyl-CoA thioesterase PaaI n=1 Tax=Alicyclobacillus sp. SO9 TaxID=2665646 RepID=UPI0018E7397F|nr:hydroxyphenylacetyl-CoA thioesterase PaaI [Alicyclobacillus sp. SO9]QQE78064.1 hydroxyphenylacetyl-CoA thioesterase PaaI [Alicyclobacillus sp. SO9]